MGRKRKLFNVVAVVAVAGWFLAPYLLLSITSLKTEQDCLASLADPVCVTRMRALGNAWSYKGNLSQAETWYRRAATHGNAVSEFYLGWIYAEKAQKTLVQIMQDKRDRVTDTQEEENTFKTQTEEAIAWYQKAAEKNFAPAMNNLGAIYQKGVGLKISRAEALQESFKWYLEAAKYHNPVAQMNVTHAYLSGQGTPMSEVSAKLFSVWDPQGCGPENTMMPVLERTFFMGMPLPQGKIAYLRQAFEQKVPVTYTEAPLQRDPRLPTFEESTGQKSTTLEEYDTMIGHGVRLNGSWPLQYHSTDPSLVKITLHPRQEADASHTVVLRMPRAALTYANRYDAAKTKLPDEIDAERIEFEITTPNGVPTSLRILEVASEEMTTSNDASAKLADNKLDVYVHYAGPDEKSRIIERDARTPFEGEYDGLQYVGTPDSRAFFGRDEDGFYRIDCRFPLDRKGRCEMKQWIHPHLFVETLIPDFRSNGGAAAAREIAKLIDMTIRNYQAW